MASYETLTAVKLQKKTSPHLMLLFHLSNIRKLPMAVLSLIIMKFLL